MDKPVITVNHMPTIHTSNLRFEFSPALDLQYKIFKRVKRESLFRLM